MADAENINPKRSRPAKKPPKKITEKYLYNSGLAYLERFPASVPHFRRIMGRKIDKSCNFHKDQDKEACLQMLDTTVATFERQGLLNDDAYTTGMVTSLRRRGLSSRAIHYKLQSKGLGESAIREALAAFDGDTNADFTAAVQLMRKKHFGCFGKQDQPMEEKERNRQLSSFARAGFGFDLIQKALALTLDEAEEILYQRPY
jgi:regulatory protein